MFPDSRVAENCARTKTCVIKGALAPAVCQKVVMQCQTQPFTILIDESNDRACDKEVAILVRVWDHNIRHVATRFLDMPVCNICVALAAIPSGLLYSSRSIPWANVKGYMLLITAM